jgi:exodeoxyribonuclease-3
LKIATFNANSIRARLGIVEAWLEKESPDVLCIQETKAQDQDFPLEPLQACGYHVTFRGQKGYNGVATLTREEPEDITPGFSDDGPSDETRLLTLKVGGVSIVNTYVPQGRAIDHEMYAYKISWFRRLRAYFDARYGCEDNLVWLGDMNVAHDPIDVHNPKERTQHVCYHEDARAAFVDCRAWGFVDVFRKHHPEPGHYTFFDYRTADVVKRGMGWRIDYILTNPGMADRCTDAYIDIEPRLADKPSDHTFLVAEFK